MIYWAMSWMIEISLILSIWIWMCSKNLKLVQRLSWICLISNIIAYYFSLSGGGCFSTKSALLSAFHSPEVYYWDQLTAIMTGLNIFATGLTALYQLQDLRKETSDQIGLLWMTFSCVQGIFCCQNAILFYMFFELSVIPLSLWILHFPSKEADFSVKQFVMYTCGGSMFFLIGLIICYMQLPTPSWIFQDLGQAIIPGTLTAFVPFCFLIPFLIKVPLWPMHGWLPLAHTQAPTEGSVILASVVLKIGGYGLLRLIPLMGSTIAQVWSPILIVMGIFSLLSMSLSAYQQTDWKCLIAYSSIVHMAWVVIGVGLLIGKNPISSTIYQGIVFQMISHGVISMALFLIVGMLSHRTNTREIQAYKGMASTIPVFTKYITFFMLANAALPGTSGFIGEFLILQGLYQHSILGAFLACFSLVTTMAFNLQYFIPLLLDDSSAEKRNGLISDCQNSEHLFLAPLAAIIFYLGISPGTLFSFFAL